MANCTPCYVDTCITAPSDCRVAAPGGWQRLWFLNRCDIQRFVFESVNGFAQTRVKDIILKSGAGLYSLHFYRKTGVKFEAQAVDENGWRWDHELILPLTQRDGETMATLQRMVGAELVFIGLHRDGRYYIAGLGEEGFRMENWNDTKGRTPSDGAIQELTFRLSESRPQTELLYDDGVAATIDERLTATQTWLQSLDTCAEGSLTVNADPDSVTFTSGITSTATIELTVQRNNSFGDLTLDVPEHNLPSSIEPIFDSTIQEGTNTITIDLAFNGSSISGTYFLTAGVSHPNGASDTVNIIVNTAT